MLKKISTFIQKKDKLFDFIDLIHKWPEIVGKDLSRHTIPLKNKQDTLVIITNHPTHAQTLHFMQKLLKKKIITEFPSMKKMIKNIRFQYNPTLFNQKRQSDTTSPPLSENSLFFHPYSPEHKKLKKEAENELKNITDPQLKEKLISLYLQLKAREK